MRQKIFNLSSFLVLWFFANACKPHEDFKAIKDLKNSNWAEDKKMSFSFDITDVNKAYDVSFLIRNSADYPFYNLYLKRTLRDSTDKVLTKRMEEVILFDAKSGKPLGNGLGDIFEHKFRSSTLKNFKFPSAGKYTLTIEQFMRQDPLKGVVSVGVTVEPVYAKQ